MRKNKLAKWTAALMIPSMLLGGCGLLPAEDSGGRIVLVQSKESVSYELAQAAKGDVELTKLLYCTYAQLKEENLSFGLDGKQVQYVYVRAGDTVKEGDLLAKLNTDDIDQKLSDVIKSIERNELELTQTQELKEFELKDLKKKYNAGSINLETYNDSKAEIEQRYSFKIQNYEDTLYIARLRREKYEGQKVGSEIYAGMDGTVSYVRSDLQGSRSRADLNVITIIDSSQCAFRTDTYEFAKYMKAGETIYLTNGSGMQYPTVVMSASEAPDTDHVYLALKELDFGLNVGARATVNLVLDSRKDVLCVPVSVLHHADGEAFVYCQDEGGLKQIRKVTVGLVGTTNVEILDGLVEGDIVIKK